MSKKYLSFVIFFSFIFSLFFFRCGIPQVLPFLNIPIADQNSISLEIQINFDTTTVIYTCNNSEDYFKGYYFYYRDSNQFLKKGYFSYFDEIENKWKNLSSIPTATELNDFKNQEDFKFTFYMNNATNNFPNSNQNNIRDSYFLLTEDEKNFSTLYESGKTITIYLIPIGEDIYGFYIYTPAFSTYENRVIFNFK